MKVFWLVVFVVAGLTAQFIWGQVLSASAEPEPMMSVIEVGRPEPIPPPQIPKVLYPKELTSVVADPVYREKLIRNVNDAAREYQVSPWLIWTVVKYEGTYQHFQGSKVKRGNAQEVGVAQLMPRWGRRFGHDLFDLRDNVRCCARLLQYARDEEGLTETQEILGWYNTGKKVVNRYAWRGHRQYHLWLARGG